MDDSQNARESPSESFGTRWTWRTVKPSSPTHNIQQKSTQLILATRNTTRNKKKKLKNITGAWTVHLNAIKPTSLSFHFFLCVLHNSGLDCFVHIHVIPNYWFVFLQRRCRLTRSQFLSSFLASSWPPLPTRRLHQASCTPLPASMVGLFRHIEMPHNSSYLIQCRNLHSRDFPVGKSQCVKEVF